MNKNIIILLAAALVAIVVVNLISTPNTSNVKIGTILSETGFASAFGKSNLDGVKLALKEINASRPADKQVVLVSEDDGTDTNTGLSKWRKLTEVDKVQGVIGSNFDFVTKPVFELAKSGNVPAITATSPRIPGSFDMNQNTFSMTKDFDKIVSALDKFLTEGNYKKYATIQYDSSFGSQISSSMKLIAQKNGKPEAYTTKYKEIGGTDWKPYILSLKQNNVDVVFLDLLGEDMYRFSVDAKNLKYNGVLINYMDIRNVLKKEDRNLSSLENVIVLNWDMGQTKEFSEKFYQNYNYYPENNSAEAYKATYMLVEAIEKNPTNPAKYLAENTFTTPLGKFKFTADHTAETQVVAVQRIVNGQLVTLYETK